MRNPNRIPKYMDRLEAIWKKVPDYRLGQFMSNMMSIYYSETHRDPFFPEDEDFMTVIENYFKKCEQE